MLSETSKLRLYYRRWNKKLWDFWCNININNLDASLGFTKISWDTINEFNAFILYLINRGLYTTAEVASNDDKLMALVTCDPRDNNKRIVLLAKNGF